jgi:tyrosine-protein kinase Etk/Wzc
MSLLGPNATAPVKTILITSPEEATGKSTTALNCAITMAKAGRRTVIVDADMFRPAIHRLLDCSPAAGLDRIVHAGDVLQNEQAYATGIDNLFAVTTPHPVTHSGEFFGSREMVEWIGRLKASFDIILFDAPPVLVATDAAFLSAHCDVTVFVVCSGKTSAEALEQTVADVRSVGAHVAGVILNRFQPSRIYGYKFTYGYMYKDHTQSIPRI